MALASSLTDAGLSPLARGTLHGFGFLFDGRRFIPAGAGNTYIRAKNKATATVYPRWRGEHIYQNISFYSHGGLSPLARGTRIKHGLTRRAARFIPAGAGNTGSVCGSIAGGAGNTVDGEFFIAGAPVYPRWRGEHDRLRHLAVADQGLSPLARGTPRQKVNAAKNERFIPAGAGNTIKKLFCVSFRSVYPRWRGEHNEYWSSILMRRGLSPLARGTL